MEQTNQQKQDRSKETSEQFLQRLTESSLEQKVEEMAALLFTIADIALFIGMDVEEL